MTFTLYTRTLSTTAAGHMLFLPYSNSSRLNQSASWNNNPTDNCQSVCLTGTLLTLLGMVEPEHVVFAEDDAAAGPQHHRLGDGAPVHVTESAIVRDQHHHPLPVEWGGGEGQMTGAEQERVVVAEMTRPGASQL